MTNFTAGISLCMIVKNEEAFLPAALDSVAGVVDELCIVDTGSTDRTREIALARGARVVDFPWRDDFAAARNAALALATRRWIFVLDADEQLAAGSRAALAAIGQMPTAQRGRWIACRNLMDVTPGSGAMTNALVRLFPNDPRIRYRNRIHEFIALDGNDAGLPADRTALEIVHHGYLSAIVVGRAKADRNLRLSRLAAEQDPHDGFHQYNLGMASLLAGDRQGALEALERMHELTRATPRGYRVHGLVTLADLLADVNGDVQSALALVTQCLQLVPKYSNAHFAHGRFLARDGKLFEARNAFGRAIAAGAYDGEQFVVDNEIAIWKAHSEIGGTLMREGRFAQALAWFELASLVRPEAVPLIINRAKCHEALGDMETARGLFASAFRIGGDMPSAIEWINYLLRRNCRADALTAIAAAVPLVDAGNRVVLLGTAAAIHLRAEDVEKAQDAIDSALTMNGRASACAIIETLAAQLAQPRLLDLVGTVAGKRAKALHIAYVSSV